MISFSKLLDDCLIALGDSDGSTWNRTTVIKPWAVQAILEFPVLRPQHQDVTYISATYSQDITSDFRELISVEYPLNQNPPEYLVRMNRLDPEFYGTDDHYDVDRNFEDNTGWILYTSRKMQVGDTLKINYLSNHKSDNTDDVSSYISVPDEYENILIANVVMRAYRERLGVYMQDPTTYINIIQQMVHMVEAAEASYKFLAERAQTRFAESRRLPHVGADKFDRVY